MRTPWIAGTALAVTAGLLVAVGAASVELTTTAMLGAAIGAALGLVPDGGPGGRLGAWAAGFALAWVAYFARAALLPDTATGRAVAAVVVVLLLTVLCGIARDRLPLWAGLLGVAALVGAYETSFNADPARVATESTAAATTVALAAALGFLVAGVVTAAQPPRTRVAGDGHGADDGGDGAWADDAGPFPAHHDHHSGDPVGEHDGGVPASGPGTDGRPVSSSTGEAAPRLGGTATSTTTIPPKGQA